MYYFPFSLKFLSLTDCFGVGAPALLSAGGSELLPSTPREPGTPPPGMLPCRLRHSFLCMYCFLLLYGGMEQFSYELRFFVLVLVALQSCKHGRHMENTRWYHCCSSLISELRG